MHPEVFAFEEKWMVDLVVAAAVQLHHKSEILYSIFLFLHDVGFHRHEYPNLYSCSILMVFPWSLSPCRFLLVSLLSALIWCKERLFKVVFT